MLGCEPPTPELDAHAADPAEATVARALKAAGAVAWFSRRLAAEEARLGGIPTTVSPAEHAEWLALGRCAMAARMALVRALAPDWPEGRRAWAAISTEWQPFADGIEAAVRGQGGVRSAARGPSEPDPAEAPVARAVALLKAYGYFERCLGWADEANDREGARRYAACALLAQAELVALLAPHWTPERRAAVAMPTEPDAAIAEIERAARGGRA